MAASPIIRTLVLPLVALAVDALLLTVALGGLAPLRAHRVALVLLAIWFASNVTLAVLRPVGSQDPVATRADARLVMLALGLIPLLAPPLSAFGERAGLLNAPWAAAPAALVVTLPWIGVALAALGLVIRIAAMRHLGARFSPRIAVQREHALETEGPYASVRHPGYLGALLTTAGGVLAFTSMLAWPLLALMFVAHRARARREEALLEAHFGDAWRAYAARTGRFLPRIGA